MDMTHTDRELLERAARAVGITLAWDFDGPELATKDGRSTSYRWNPLTDDGDALRLAVKLRLSTNYHYYEGMHFVDVRWDSMAAMKSEKLTSDPGVTTRRAIVRAAAEVGKGMK